MRAALDDLTAEMVASGDATAVAAVVGDAEAIFAESRAGWRDRARTAPIGRWDRFDFASLTKPWTATLALRLERRLPLTLTLGEVLSSTPELWRDRSLECLLRHRSGLPAWRPMFRDARTPSTTVDRLLACEATSSVPTYSDLGYVIYGAVATSALGSSLATLMRRRVCRPLGVGSVDVDAVGKGIYCALGNDREVELAAGVGVRIRRRGPVARGEPQDGNARFLGGLPGHAGLFGTAFGAWRLGTEWLAPRRLLTREQVARALGGPGRYRLGWWRRPAARSATRPLSVESFGHHGFTGCSLWVDPVCRRVLALLAHRSSIDTDLDPWRTRFHRLALPG